MKKVYNIILAAACLAAAASCQLEKSINLASWVTLSQKDEVTVASKDAADLSVGVTSDGDWVVVVPSWIKARPAYGSGNGIITFSFADNWTDGEENGDRHATVHVECASGATSFSVCQKGDPDKPSDEVKTVTVGEFLTSPVNGQIYELTGTVSNIKNKTYGNFDLVDETGSVYIYGCLDMDGNSKNFSTLDVEEGDQLTVQGAKSLYNGTVEIVDAQYISHVKSLVKLFDTSISLPKDETDFEVRLTYKGTDVRYACEADWISFVGTATRRDTTVLMFHAQANPLGEARTAQISLTSAKSEKEVSTKAVTVRQALDPSAAGGDMTDISTITGAADDSAVEAKNVYVAALTTRGYVATDGKTAVYVYTNSTPTVAIGDRVNFSGKKTTYFGLPEITNPQTDVLSSGNTVPYPTPKDITAGFDSYNATIAEYVTVEATAFKDGNYTNFRVAGATTYTLALSSAPTSMYDGIAEGDKVQVTGYFNTINSTRKQIQVIAVTVKKK